MMRKYLNLLVGVEFCDALMSRLSFQQNWKAVSPAFYLVGRIAELNARNNGEAVEFFSGTIATIFQPYTGGVYSQFLSDMEGLKILDIDHRYKATPNKNGHCKKYKVTDYGCRLVHSANMAYLKALKDDPALRRQNQRSISKRKVMSKTLKNPVLAYVHDGLKHLSFDYGALERTFTKSAWSDAQKTNVSGTLRTIAEKTFKEPEFTAGDGRIHHEVVRLKSDTRFLLRYKGMPYKAALDIRCCHPTFFSAYLRHHPITLHYVTHKGDMLAALEHEHKKWLALFCDPAEDPKEVVRKACRFTDDTTAKAAMNQSLNGSKRYPKYLAWLKREFPTLYEIWQQTDVADTGNAIARTFEHELVLHTGLCERAEAMGVKILSEHDGIGVFATDDGLALQSKLDSLASYIKSYSAERFGIPIVVKTKLAFDWASADLLTEMEHKLDELGKDYGKLKPCVNRAQRLYFSANRDTRHGQAYAEARKKEHQLLLRYKDVIESWAARERHELC